MNTRLVAAGSDQHDYAFPKVAVLSSYMRRSKRVSIDHPEGGGRTTLHYHVAYYFDLKRIPVSFEPDINWTAMKMIDAGRPAFVGRKLYAPLGDYREMIIGAAFLSDGLPNRRYARVVTLKDEGWEREDFEEWAAMNFEGEEHPPGIVGNSLGTYAFCEDPDQKQCQIKLAMTRLRFG